MCSVLGVCSFRSGGVNQNPVVVAFVGISEKVYPHKILTGRRERMHTLRQSGGLSGFAKRAESEYDCFGAGHSSTSISAAMGMSVGKAMMGKVSRKGRGAEDLARAFRHGMGGSSFVRKARSGGTSRVGSGNTAAADLREL